MQVDNPNTFVHLNVHSEFSLIDSVVRIKDLTRYCAELGMPALALTDHVNTFALVKFYRCCLVHGIKPIIGADMRIVNHDNDRQPFHLLLLCQNEHGYKNLLSLISLAYTDGQAHGLSIINRDNLTQYSEGLIALSTGLAGEIGQSLLADNRQAAVQALDYYQATFPQRFYLEVQRIGQVGEESYIQQAVALANERQLPLVATNRVRFLQKQDFDAHEARVCIHDSVLLNDNRRQKNYSNQQYLRSPQQMVELFADLPQAIINSVEISKRCNVVLRLTEEDLPDFQLKQVFLPDFPVPQGMNSDSYLIEQAQKGLADRLEFFAVIKENHQQYYQRLEFELDIITKMGFSGYFLIVADFIQWAKNHHIPVGPGRGSGAGSLVAYALKITDPDPLAYGLLFERFLNPERISMPDFDIDFCIEGRDRVIDYVADKYGRHSVSQIITFGTMAARAVVRDVGRVLGHNYGYVDRIAKLIPFELNMTLEKALQEQDLKTLYQQDEEVAMLIDLAKSLEGLARNAGKHAAGVVIAPGKLTDFTALYCEQQAEGLVSQLDKKDIEAVGLVKFDFLGLRNLTIIETALKMINNKRQQQGEQALNMSSIPLDDDKTFELLCNCQTTAIFQLESRGMTELIKKLQPNCLDDIVSLVALFRPGPLQSGMVDDFIDRRHGRAPVDYPHPLLEPILKPTYGVIVYQEQVMEIARVLAGYTMGGADVLRSAMGKKKIEEMAKQRIKFVEGATNRDVDSHLAGSIFDLMEKFAEYGFNKSHSVCYALIAYQTAYLKARYPAEFMAAVLSSDMDNTDKVLRFFNDVQALGLTVLPPDINNSDHVFTVNDDNEIIYGLGAIKGAGEAALSSIIIERQQNGLFQDIFDFCQRNDLRKVNKKVIEALIKSGAMDQLGSHRAELLANLPMVLQAVEHQAHHQDQHDLFSADSTSSATIVPLKPISQWPMRLQLQAERVALGLYLSGHPMQIYRREFQSILRSNLSQIKPTQNQTIMVAGLVVAVRNMMTKRGQRMAFVTLDDGCAQIEMAIFSDIYQQYKPLLSVDEVIIVECDVSVDRFNDGYRLSCKKLWTTNQFRQQRAKKLFLSLPQKMAGNDFSQQLAKLLQSYRGGNCPICIRYQQQQAEAAINLGDEWKVTVEDNLLSDLESILPSQYIQVVY